MMAETRRRAATAPGLLPVRRVDGDSCIRNPRPGPRRNECM